MRRHCASAISGRSIKRVSARQVLTDLILSGISPLGPLSTIAIRPPSPRCKLTPRSRDTAALRLHVHAHAHLVALLWRSPSGSHSSSGPPCRASTSVPVLQAELNVHCSWVRQNDVKLNISGIATVGSANPIMCIYPRREECSCFPTVFKRCLNMAHVTASYFRRSNMASQ